MQTIAAFDLGIKNLCYCVASFDESGLTKILRWKNMSLLAEGASSQSQTRCGCGGPAAFLHDTTLFCKKCAKRSEIPTYSGSMKVADLRAFVAGVLDLDVKILKTAGKEELLTQIAEGHLLPYKAPKVKGFSMQEVLRQMEICLTAELPYLASASLLRIENQPSDFGHSRMQSVQAMLFTLLDHRLRTEHEWSGTIEFANASVKTKGTTATTGAAGKRSRKVAAIERVDALLKAMHDEDLKEQYDWWLLQAKKDDLSDALLMCVDGA